MSDDKSVFLDDDQLGTAGDQDKLHAVLDTQRWLMNNGFLNDMIKDQLYMYGAIVHKDVGAVELSADVVNKKVSYILYLPTSLLKKHKKFLELREKTDSVWALWRFKRLLKKEGNLDFSVLIDNFIKSFCGPKWVSEVEVRDLAEYVDGYEGIEGQPEPASQLDKQPDS